MQFLWLHHEQIDYDKHYPIEKKTVHHYKFLRTKSKLGAVLNVSVKFAQGTSPV